MNIQMRDITVTAREGRVSHVDKIYVRGSHIRLFVVPDMLKNAPMFRQQQQQPQPQQQQTQGGDKRTNGRAPGQPVKNLVEKGRSRR